MRDLGSTASLAIIPFVKATVHQGRLDLLGAMKRPEQPPVSA